MASICYNLPYHWFIGLATDDAVWDTQSSTRTVFARPSTPLWSSFFTEVMRLTDERKLLSKEHLLVVRRFRHEPTTRASG